MRSDQVDRQPRATPPRLRWGAVARVSLPFVILASLAAGLRAADAWLPLVPRELGQRLTESFLQALLIGYLTVLVALPSLLVLSVLLMLRARRHGRRLPIIARMGLLAGSGILAVLAMELAAALWLAWLHRMPVLPTSFTAQPAGDASLSLVVIGGSSALGYPYDPNLSVGQIVGWQLEEVMRGMRVDVDIRANLARNLEDMHLSLAGLKRRPDAMIIYSGHNEFLSRFDTARDAGYAEAPRGAFLDRLYDSSLRSPFCRWVYETMRKHRLGGPPPLNNHRRLLDVPLFTRSELHERVVDFGRRLEAIVAWCKQVGCEPILVIPPSNESGYEPNRSVLLPPPAPERAAELAAAFEAARKREAASPEDSLAGYRSLIAEAPEFAEVHFRLGRLLEAAGAYDEARTHYIKAKDLDGFPVRCRSDFVRFYHEVATRHGCLLIDAPEVLRRMCRHGILDDTIFHDAHHPSFAGHLAIAQAILDGLHRRRALGLDGGGEGFPAVNPSECAAHFRVDANVWAGACARAGTYYKQLGGARFDPSERLAKHERLMRAAVDLRAGRVSPDDTGVPGIGLASPPDLPFDWWNASSPMPPSRRQVSAGPRNSR